MNNYIKTYMLNNNVNYNIEYNYFILNKLTFLNYLNIYYNIFKIKYFKILKYVLCLLIFIISIIYYNYYKLNYNFEIKNSSCKKTISNLNQKNLILKNSLKITNTELLQIKNSKNYKRFFIYNNSNVFIPNNIDSAHLIYMENCRKKYDIPINIYYKQINQESKFKINAISNKGAFGYCQLMPETYKLYLKKLKLKPNSIESQIEIGAFYLYEGFKLSNSWEKALRRYNSGKLNGFNLETNNYVKKILN